MDSAPGIHVRHSLVGSASVIHQQELIEEDEINVPLTVTLSVFRDKINKNNLFQFSISFHFSKTC